MDPNLGVLMAITRMRRLCGAAGVVLLATTLAACAGSPADPAAMSSQQPDSPPPTETPAPMPNPVTFKSNVKNSASNVKVDTVVTVKADWGTLTKVKLSYTNTDRQGRKQQG